VAETDEKRERTPEEIQAEIEATRERLVRNLEQLKAETKPAALMARAKEKASSAFIEPSTGQVRVERVAVVVGVVVGLVLVRKGLKARAHRKQLERLSKVVWVPVPREGLRREFRGIARDATELSDQPAMAQITAG
jgi:hypothetical protein